MNRYRTYPGDDDSTMEEARERLDKFKAEAIKEGLCLRHLINSDGMVRISVRGLKSCPDCGGPVWQ